jgi:uncharacterized membrane protein YkvA (DUF1232 family)
MEVAENTTVQKTVSNAKKKTAKIKDEIGQFISRTPLFKSLQGRASQYFNNPEALTEEFTRFYNEATHEDGRKTITDIWKKLQQLYFMVRDGLSNRYKELTKPKIAIGIAVLLYAIMPADLIPDVLPVLGFADDAALLAWFFKLAAKEVKQYEQWLGTLNPQPAITNASY